MMGSRRVALVALLGTVLWSILIGSLIGNFPAAKADTIDATATSTATPTLISPAALKSIAMGQTIRGDLKDAETVRYSFDGKAGQFILARVNYQIVNGDQWVKSWVEHIETGKRIPYYNIGFLPANGKYAVHLEAKGGGNSYALTLIEYKVNLHGYLSEQPNSGEVAPAVAEVWKQRVSEKKAFQIDLIGKDAHVFVYSPTYDNVRGIRNDFEHGQNAIALPSTIGDYYVVVVNKAVFENPPRSTNAEYEVYAKPLTILPVEIGKPVRSKGPVAAFQFQAKKGDKFKTMAQFPQTVPQAILTIMGGPHYDTVEPAEVAVFRHSEDRVEKEFTALDNGTYEILLLLGFRRVDTEFTFTVQQVN